jgi:glycosyltransferase involved in cell wall biosynthesis
MKIAYLASEYPKVTHSFIRRELKGVESSGIDVERIAIRRPQRGELPEAADREELDKTSGVLDRGLSLALDVGMTALRRPTRWLRAAERAVRLGIHSQRGLTRHLIYFVEACAVSRMAEEHGVSHIHAHFATNATTVALLVDELGGPSYSFMIHGPSDFDAPELIHLSEKVAGAKFVTVITDFARSQTWRWARPEDWHKVHVVRCGVDDQFLQGDVEPVPDVPRFLNIGRLAGAKAQPLILQAAARLQEQGRRFEIAIIGDGELRPHLERMIDDLDVGDVVKLVGWKSGGEVRKELLRSRALLLPSFAEGLPVVIMEAFALGRPVITTKIAGIPELVVHGDNGWLISSGNLDHLVDAMAEALDSPVDRLTDMGRHGREAVQVKHDALVEAGKLAKLLDR